MDKQNLFNTNFIFWQLTVDRTITTILGLCLATNEPENSAQITVTSRHVKFEDYHIVTKAT